MHHWIEVYWNHTPAGLFDMDRTAHTGRFEWLPSFVKDHSPFTEAFPMPGIHPYIAFDAAQTLPPPFGDYLAGAFARDLLFNALKNTPPEKADRSTLAWLSLTGDRGYGAFRFEPAGYPELNTVEPIDLGRIVKHLDAIKDGHTLTPKALREVLRCSLFTRGSHPKVLLAINDFTGEVLSGQGAIPDGYAAWIAKLDNGHEWEIHQLARACGILSPACRQIRYNGRKHLLIQRFDRKGNERIPFVSYAAWGPSELPTWTSVFRKMRQLRLPVLDMEEMYRRLAFYSIVRHGPYTPSDLCFTYTPKDGWRLAPAFHFRERTSTGLHPDACIEKGIPPTLAVLRDLGDHLGLRKAKRILDGVNEKIQECLPLDQKA
jgi:serine/threonine-protein kinase HipA